VPDLPLEALANLDMASIEKDKGEADVLPE